jgi:hypothetical protein
MEHIMTYLTIEGNQIQNQLENILVQNGVSNFTVEKKTRGVRSEAYYFNLHQFDGLTRVNGDSITPRILVFNSYDGSSAFHIHVGFIRWACSNGMIAGDSFFSQRIVHRVGPTATQKLAELEAGVIDAVAYLRDEFENDMTELTSKEMTEESMIDVVGSLSQLSKRSKDTVIRQITLPVLRRDADKANNLWILWNLINEEIARSCRSRFSEALKNKNLLNDVKLLAEVA